MVFDDILNPTFIISIIGRGAFPRVGKSSRSSSSVVVLALRAKPKRITESDANINTTTLSNQSFASLPTIYWHTNTNTTWHTCAFEYEHQYYYYYYFPEESINETNNTIHQIPTEPKCFSKKPRHYASTHARPWARVQKTTGTVACLGWSVQREDSSLLGRWDWSWECINRRLMTGWCGITANRPVCQRILRCQIGLCQYQHQVSITRNNGRSPVILLFK